MTRSDAPPTRVSLERGNTWVFATALDWPGWCRRGKGEQAALDALLEYADRYAPIGGSRFRPGRLEVVGTVGGNRTTDFGAPAAIGPWDHEHLEPGEADRLVGILRAGWEYLDAVVAAAPAELRKGPRGGGRNRDAIADHVREAERAYAAKVGARIRPRTPWVEQRATAAAALATGVSEGAWPVRYAIRRCAWHVVDHAWEIEDRGET